jgi:hypothetical protein
MWLRINAIAIIVVAAMLWAQLAGPALDADGKRELK